MFARWGRFVYRFRWVVLVGSGVLLALSLVSIFMGGTLTSGGPLRSNLESYKANQLLNNDFATSSSSTPTTTSFDLIFKSDTLSINDQGFENAVTAALQPIQDDSRVVHITTPYNVNNPAAAQALTSKDGHEALVVVEIKGAGSKDWPVYNDLRSKVQSSSLTIWGTGFLPVNQAFNKTLESDLQRAEFVTFPVTLVLLIIIFASAVAAGLPVGVGILTIVGGIGGTLFLNRFTDVSQYAINIVTLIGLGVSIDYSLFIVNRFRDELAKGASREDAIATTMATAGRAVTFSGLTVAVGLSAMLFFQGTFMASMGAAGAIVVGIAVLYALTFLPAMLSVVGPVVSWKAMSRTAQIIFWALTLAAGALAAAGFALSRLAGLSLTFQSRLNQVALVSVLLAAMLALIAFQGRRARRARRTGRGFWATLANWVMRRPIVVLVPTVAFLVIAATPFLNIRLANGNVDMLPSHIESRQGYDRLVADFPGQDQTTFNIVVDYPDGQPLTQSRIADQYALTRRIAQIPGILHVSSIYNIDQSLGLSQYEDLYTGNPNDLPAQVRQAMASSVGKHIVVINATSNADPSSDAARNILKAIRADNGVSGGQILVTGDTAFDVDVIKFIYDRVPLAVATVVVLTYILLFLLTGSVVLPLKAVILNFLSIGASFGALVFIFQQGHFSNILGFTAQSLDPSIPVILFSIVFGLSMDYEVLLVSRMHEEYVRLGDNTKAVASGLERTGRLITGAAAIMFAVFMAFGLAEVVIIKAIGIGLAIAVAIDATIVRSLIVPAVMRLLGDVNWWAPRPLRWLHSKAGLSDLGVHEEQPVRRTEPEPRAPAPEPEPEVAAV